MIRIGITGHANLTASSVPIVAEAIKRTLRHRHRHAGPSTTMTEVTCLARRADQIFAQAVLDLGGRVEVILPAGDYRERKVKPANAAQFDHLISQASVVHTMPFAVSNREAYMAASEHMLNAVHEMLAVWDGRSAGGHGGTGDVVAAANARGIRTEIIWPHGTQREP